MTEPNSADERDSENERLRRKFEEMWDFYDIVANDSSDPCDIAVANALDHLKMAMKG